MPKYIPKIDGLRAFSIILVVLSHWSRILLCGWMGVQVFFVISGFLITQILLEQKTAGMKGFSFFKRFYIRRIFRIFPLYFAYVFLLMSFFAFLTDNNIHAGDADAMVSQFQFALPFILTYTLNLANMIWYDFLGSPFFTHLWSLCVEEQFYLIWPFLVYFLSPQKLKKLCIALIFLAPLIRLGMALALSSFYPTPSVLGRAIYYFTFSHFDAFATGGALALGVPFFKQAIPRKLFISFSTFVLLGVFMFFATGLPISTLGYPPHMIQWGQHVWGYTVINMLAVFTIAAAIDWPGFLNGVLNNRFIVHVGKVSYGIYLIHSVVIFAGTHAIRHWFGTIGLYSRPSLLGLLVSFLMMVLLATISYFTFENVFRKLKQRYF